MDAQDLAELLRHLLSDRALAVFHLREISLVNVELFGQLNLTHSLFRAGTTTKFNPKQYQEKQRIYRPVPGAPRVLRLYVWDPGSQGYEPKGYEARRYETAADSTAIRKKMSFETLEEARYWQRGVESPGHAMAPTNLDRGPLFADVVREWKGRKFPTIAASTQETYEKILNLYMVVSLGFRFGS